MRGKSVISLQECGGKSGLLAMDFCYAAQRSRSRRVGGDVAVDLVDGVRGARRVEGAGGRTQVVPRPGTTEELVDLAAGQALAGRLVGLDAGVTNTYWS